ncbi:MAG: hypothetical protein IPI40_00565 [Betaproteobacteria bacterium]|nr:hypothetical protein [Betaproteobacteria bacterium]
MSSDRARRARIVSTRFGTFGSLATASFVVAVVSGVLLAAPYDAGDAYNSLAALLLANPAGTFFRNLHYWAGQACLVLTLFHTWDHLRARTERRVAVGVWLRLVASVALITFIMLSGFLLRGDADAQQAYRILREATVQIPLVGPDLALLVFGATGALGVIYVQHAATATIVVWLFVIEHSRRVWPRPDSLLAMLAALVVVSLLASPGLHDGLDPVVKGPWYFLGLQEILHWTPWPNAVVAAMVAVLALLFTVRVVGTPRASIVKSLLVAIAIGYAGLCATGAFMRGENWAWGPTWPGATGNPRLGWVFASTPGAPTPLPSPLPTVMGRPDGCLVCHRGVTGLGNAHRPDAVGCASCHGGDALTLDKARAHAGMDVVPGNLATARLQCGQSACHAAIVPRVERSVMATMSGVVGVTRTVFADDGAAAGGAAPHVAELGHEGVDLHLRQACAMCHLGRKKTEVGPNGEDSFGGGCNACHLSYDPPARAALQAYAVSKDAGRAEPPTAHPAIGLDIGNGQCFSCHSRSGRISTSYEGWHEMHEPPADASDPDRPRPSRYRVLADTRVFEQVVPDIHHQRGLDCIDCHTANETMGDGTAHASKSAQLRVGCEDCHARPGATLPAVAATTLDPESRRILALRDWPGVARDRHVRARSGEPLVNVVVDGTGRPQLIRKRTGERRPLKAMAAVCAEGGGHERLSCGSCHTAWAPRCPTCHTAFDRRIERYDWLAEAYVQGSWEEEAGPFFANPPTLGLRRGAAATGSKEAIDTFVPGMIMTLDRTFRAGEPPDVVFRRLYARIEPHTTRTEARSCKSCHNDPEALGYGRGQLRLERVSPGVARWTFVPAAPALPQDGLPADAWIPFLGTRTGRVSTRDDVRPFNVEEQRRILTVGACLTCHDERSPPMQRAVRDFKTVVAARRPACLLPSWK